MTWPFPCDSPTVIARRVAWAYRARLEKADPDDCHDLDRILGKLGQQWATARPAVRRPDAWVSARDAAEIASLSMNQIRGLRLAGRLTGRRLGPRRWEYQVAEINALSANRRKRKDTP
jgi:hypothetical protein